jgi:hypothetical protein
MTIENIEIMHLNFWVEHQYFSPFFSVSNPFLFITNKRLFILSEGFSTLEKKYPYMLSKGNAAHPVGCDSPLLKVMVVWRPFCLNSNFLGRV